MDLVKYDYAYMFMYSERPGTLAEKKFKDDVPEDVKKRRLEEIIAKQNQHSLERYQVDIGKTFRVLIEGYSRRSNDFLQGRNSANRVVIFPKENKTKGQYVDVLIDRCSKATLFGKIV
jgi:tRNA-2-methylthio-N6-dimethylallyladenosine synthase